jgi:hypothetical protein
MLSKSMQLETELYKAIDGFVIARVEEILGCDDPGISLTAARAALQKQLRILCNEACAYQPNFVSQAFVHLLDLPVQLWQTLQHRLSLKTIFT